MQNHGDLLGTERKADLGRQEQWFSYLLQEMKYWTPP
jgi:hypothetical protein